MFVDKNKTKQDHNKKVNKFSEQNYTYLHIDYLFSLLYYNPILQKKEYPTMGGLSKIKNAIESVSYTEKYKNPIWCMPGGILVV